MSRMFPLIAGTIRIELPSGSAAPWEADDSTLDLVMASFARRNTLASPPADDDRFVRLVASRRLSWPAPAGAVLAVRTNLAQLLEDLQDEFDRLVG